MKKPFSMKVSGDWKSRAYAAAHFIWFGLLLLRPWADGAEMIVHESKPLAEMDESDFDEAHRCA
jgi:hypothetical protein